MYRDHRSAACRSWIVFPPRRILLNRRDMVTAEISILVRQQQALTTLSFVGPVMRSPARILCSRLHTGLSEPKGRERHLGTRGGKGGTETGRGWG